MEAGEQVQNAQRSEDPPPKPESNLLSKKLPLQVNVKVTETLPKIMDRSVNLSTNGKPEKITEQDPE